VTPRARFHENVRPGPSFIVVHDTRTEVNQIRSTMFQEGVAHDAHVSGSVDR